MPTPPTAIHCGGSSSTITPAYNRLDLYTADGKRLSSVRLLSEGGPLELPIAAAGDVLAVLAWLGYGTPETELIRFGNVSDGKFPQSTTVQFKAPFRRTVPVLAANGNLFLIDKIAGRMVVIDAKAGRRSLLRPVHPYPVNAAAADSDFLYLLSSDAVVKIDPGGKVLTTYRFTSAAASSRLRSV